MYEKFGLKFGGLQHKILNLVLFFLIALIGGFYGVSYYQTKTFKTVVEEAQAEQQKAVKDVSGNTMHQVIDQSMTKTNAMQAYIANDMFSDIKTDVATLQGLATGLFAHKGESEPYAVNLPNPANDGKYAAQVLFEAGVDYTQSQYLKIAAYMSDTMVAMCENSDYLNNCFIGLADGTCICVDNQSSNKFDEKGIQKPFAVRQRPWYTGAVAAGTIWFSGIEGDTYTDKIGVECAAPVYLDGKLVAVVGADLFLDAMAEYVSSSAKQGGNLCVISNEGKVIFAPDNNGVFTVQTTDKAADLRKDENAALADFVTSALEGNTGLKQIHVNGKDYYMSGSLISTVGWSVISFVDKDMTEQPTVQMLKEYDRINSDAETRFKKGSDKIQRNILIIIVAVLVLGSASALLLAGKIVKPVERMTKRIGEISGTDLAFEMEDAYKTGDEIEVLAESFATLSKRTRQYIDQITKITAEKERIGAELELATRIQADMLPNLFPAFPERPEFDIYATMTPAKEVGGDFYDFFLIDDNHLALVMADVSGKGVPAALFMMMSKILVSNFAMMGGSPAKVLEQVNAQICKKNEEDMFVTVWFGVLEISTGKVIAANAGHEYPMMKKADGTFELFKDKHGLVLGGVDGIRYKEYEFTLEKGGTLFLYTDGVAEATNADNTLFGLDRMLTALNRNPQADPKTLLENMKAAVDTFVGEAPQFDDLTMMCVKLL